MARSTDYKEEYDEQAYKLCLMGAIDEQLADFFECSVSTLNNWKLEFPKFMEAIKKGKVLADAEVAASLYGRATGYSHKEDKILSNPQEPEKPVIVETTKHYPPDTTACAIWLNNRQKSYWRHRQEGDADSAEKVAEALQNIADKLPD